VATLLQATRAQAADLFEERFSCQATELPKAAPVHIAGWDLRQYAQDVRAGNARPLQAVRGLAIHLVNKFQAASRRFLPRRLRIHGGDQYPFLEGRLGGKTPKELLDLRGPASWSRSSPRRRSCGRSTRPATTAGCASTSRC
jgi:hypothetical protein